MRANDGIVDGVIVPQLYLDALTQGREHLREDDLFVPHRRVAILLYARLTLQPNPTSRVIAVFLMVVTV